MMGKKLTDERPIEDILRAELEEWKADAERLGLALNEELYGLPMSEDIQKAQEAMRLHIALVEKEKKCVTV